MRERLRCTRVAAGVMLLVSACRPDAHDAVLAPAADVVAIAPPTDPCEGDLSVMHASVPYCLSESLRRTTLYDIAAASCRTPDARLLTTACGEYAVVSAHGDPSAPLYGSEDIYFDRTGHIVGRQSSSTEWGSRTEGVIPHCTMGSETNLCPTLATLIPRDDCRQLVRLGSTLRWSSREGDAAHASGTLTFTGSMSGTFEGSQTNDATSTVSPFSATLSGSHVQFRNLRLNEYWEGTCHEARISGTVRGFSFTMEPAR